MSYFTKHVNCNLQNLAFSFANSNEEAKVGKVFLFFNLVNIGCLLNILYRDISTINRSWDFLHEFCQVF